MANGIGQMIAEKRTISRVRSAKQTAVEVAELAEDVTRNAPPRTHWCNIAVGARVRQTVVVTLGCGVVEEDCPLTVMMNGC